MKIRGFGWGIVCIVALSLLVFSGQVKQPEKAVVQKEVAVAISADKFKLSPEIDPSWRGLETLEKQVLEDNDALQKYFKAGQFDQMAKLLEARHAVVVGEAYEMMYGKESIKFWSSPRLKGATLEIKVAMVYVSNAMGPHPKLPFPEEKTLKPPIGGKAYNAVAFVAQEIHIISKTKTGSLLHNDTYFMDLGYQHQWPCPWGN